MREQTAKELADMKEALERAETAREQSSRLATLAEQVVAAAEAKAKVLEEQAAQAEKYRQERDVLARQLEQVEAAFETLKSKSKVELENQVDRAKANLERATERAELEKEKAVLAAQREMMKEIEGVREALAISREEKAALEVKLVEMKALTQTVQRGTVKQEK